MEPDPAGDGSGKVPTPAPRSNLFSLKQKGKKGMKRKTSKTRVAPGLLRVQKDINELRLETNTSIEFPDKDDMMRFSVSIRPDDGFYKGGLFEFSFHIPDYYPHEAPKVKCLTKVYHPNIDTDGNICLNILRQDWSPVLSINSIIYGLQYLLLEPNPEDPLNKEAAQVMQDNPSLFKQNVYKSMKGHNVGGYAFGR